jgi:hypothetical protein
LDERLANHHHKKQLDTEYCTRPRTSADSLERPKQWEAAMKHEMAEHVSHVEASVSAFRVLFGKMENQRRIGEEELEK